MRKLLLLTLLLAITISAWAQTEIIKPDLSVSSKIAPDYFGPSAFPIPDMLDGRVATKFGVELAADIFDGHRGDMTEGVYLKLTAPLFSNRVTMTAWLTSLVEWYQMSEQSHEHSSLGDDISLRGHEFGDAYISTDIHILCETERRPDISLRVVLKTALGYGFFKARYYDSPGYFFDLAVGKSKYFNHSFFKEFRGALSTGFLCWQTDNGRQNDAPMYGVQAKLVTRIFTLSETFGGYVGWEDDGDRPMSIKSELRFHAGRFEPLILSQYGIKDYPYTQWRVGVAYNF
ncbi:MAG: hypothetical protein SNJ33_00540 [Rikenellaceae bacterium]